MKYFILIASLLIQYFPSGAHFPVSGGGGGYTGPGDVVSGAVAWWGLRAYSTAAAGAKAANICNSLDAACADINSLSNGNFDTTTAQGSPLNCGSTGGVCTVKTLYDQTGANKCNSNTSPCDLTQSTIALRPVLTFSCSGSLPCMTWTITQTIKSATGISAAAQPISISAVSERTGSTTSFSDITSGDPSGGTQFGFASTTNTALLYGGSVATKSSVNDNAIHAMQGLLNGASSVIYVDGSSSNVSAGTNAPSSSFCMGNCNNGLAGISMEAGWWSGDKSASFSSMNSNQHSYWGF